MNGSYLLVNNQLASWFLSHVRSLRAPFPMTFLSIKTFFHTIDEYRGKYRSVVIRSDNTNNNNHTHTSDTESSATYRQWARTPKWWNQKSINTNISSESMCIPQYRSENERYGLNTHPYLTWWCIYTQTHGFRSVHPSVPPDNE